MNRDTLLKGLSITTVVSETEVRTKIAIPIFQYLGFDDGNRAEEFPIYAYEGRKPLHAKPADILFFDSNQHHEHRDREQRKWVQEHSLIVVELKKPSETIEVQGQAEFYALWARAPFYVITNGTEFAVYRMEGLFNDRLELKCTIQDLAEHLPQLERLLRPERVLVYRAENQLKPLQTERTDYSGYVATKRKDLRERLRHSIARTLSDYVGLPVLSLPLTLSGIQSDAPTSIRYTGLLTSKRSLVIVAEPGAGKTYLQEMLALEAIERAGSGALAPIPIVIQAKLWKRAFSTLADAIFREVEPYVPGITKTMVEDDLRNGVFIVLVDGVDEVTREVSILYEELLALARSTPTQIMVTCRRHRYYEELHELFATYKIDPLTDEQVNHYAAQVLGQAKGSFSVLSKYGISKHGPSLSALIRFPLFLIMTVSVLKAAPASKLPRNRSVLYESFSRLLLSEWHRAKSPAQPLVVDQGVKVCVLAEYASRTFGKGPSDMELNEAIIQHKQIYDAVTVRSELLQSGLLIESSEGPEFFHPSFQEYFQAVFLARAQDSQLVSFTRERHRNDADREVFLFLAGLLQEERRQALLLDFLEENNLSLYQQCLNTRFDRSKSIARNWNQEFAGDYFAQVRASYLRMVKAPFRPVMPLFTPWNMVDPNQAASCDIAIQGWVEPGTPAVSYNLTPVVDGSDSPLVTVLPVQPAPIISFQDPAGQTQSIGITGSYFDSTGYAYHNLQYAAEGIDSAREVAFLQAKYCLSSLLKDRGTHLIDNQILGCEFVQSELKQLVDLASSGEMDLPKELQDISLTSSGPGEVIGVLKRCWPPESGPLPLVLVRLFLYLKRLDMEGLSASKFLLPQSDIAIGDVPNSQTGPTMVTDLWSDQQLCRRIGRFYDFFQRSYRFIVEAYFPSFRNDLYLYKVGPVRYHVTVSRRAAPEYGGSTSVRWEPAAASQDWSTLVELVDTLPNRPDNESLQDESNRLRRLLQSLGRKTADVRSGSGHWLSHYLRSGEIIREEVYKRLYEEFEEVLGRF